MSRLKRNMKVVLLSTELYSHAPKLLQGKAGMRLTDINMDRHIHVAPMYHFVAVFGLDGHTAIFGVAGLAVVAAQHTCVCACDAEEA